MPNNNEPITVKFRCPAELDGKLPPPVQATSGLPGWLKAMPTQAFNAINMREEDTIKRCPPFVDAMTCGFLIPLICDLRIENGSITWDNELPPGGDLDFPRSPVGFLAPLSLREIDGCCCCRVSTELELTSRWEVFLSKRT